MSPRRPRAARAVPRSAGTPASVPPDAGAGLTARLARTFFALLLRQSTFFLRVFQGLQIPPVHARTLLFLDPARPITMRELSRASGFTPSHLTGIVDALEEEGLVVRRASEADRRIKVVSATRAGSRLIARIAAGMSAPSPWMRALGPQQQRKLIALLDVAVGKAEPPAGPAALLDHLSLRSHRRSRRAGPRRGPSARPRRRPARA